MFGFGLIKGVKFKNLAIFFLAKFGKAKNKMTTLYPQSDYFTFQELWEISNAVVENPKKTAMKLQATFLGNVPFVQGIVKTERNVTFEISRTTPKVEDKIIVLPSHLSSKSNTVSDSKAKEAPKFKIESLQLGAKAETTFTKLMTELSARPTVVNSILIEKVEGLIEEDLTVQVEAKSLFGTNEPTEFNAQSVVVIDEIEFFVFEINQQSKMLTGTKEFSIQGLGEVQNIKVIVDFNESYDLFE